MKIGDLVMITHTLYAREIGVIVEIDEDGDPTVFIAAREDPVGFPGLSLGRSSRELFFKTHVKMIYESR